MSLVEGGILIDVNRFSYEEREDFSKKSSLSPSLTFQGLLDDDNETFPKRDACLNAIEHSH